MADKIDELLKNEKWMKKNRLPKKLEHEETDERRNEEEIERERLANVRKYEKQGFDANMEAFKTPASETVASWNYWVLGHTGPKPWFDSWPQGGNAYPRRRRREHPSGHHNCGFY